MRFAHHVTAVKFSLLYRVAASIAGISTQQLRTSVLRYYCFNIVQQE